MNYDHELQPQDAAQDFDWAEVERRVDGVEEKDPEHVYSVEAGIRYFASLALRPTANLRHERNRRAALMRIVVAAYVLRLPQARWITSQSHIARMLGVSPNAVCKIAANVAKAAGLPPEITRTYRRK
jgi:hypothetical protein